MRFKAWLIAGLFMWAAALCNAQTGVPAIRLDPGWAGLYRPGELAPFYVTITLPNQMPAIGSLEVHAYQDSRSTVILTAEVPLQPHTTTFCIPLSIGSIASGTSVTLRDAAGRAIAFAALDETAASITAIGARNTGASLPSRLAIYASASSSVGPGPGPGDFITVHTPISRLPELADLYESVDVLILPAQDLALLTPAQTLAITSWVYAGGRVMVCVSEEGYRAIDAQGPLLALLPEKPTTPAGAFAFRGLGRAMIFPAALTPGSRAAAGALIGEIKPRLSTADVRPPVPGSTMWHFVMVVVLIAGLLAGPAEAICRRSHNLWPWPGHVLVGVGVAVVAGICLAIIPAAGAIEGAILIDQAPVSNRPDSPVMQIAITRYASASVLVGERRNIRVPESADYKTTHHDLIRLSLADGQPELVSAPAGRAGLISQVLMGAPEVAVLTRTDDVIELGQDVDSLVLETSAGVRLGKQTSPRHWQLGPPSGMPPGPFIAAARLTPVRSALLQGRMPGGATLLWTQTGTRFTRTYFP